MNHYTYEGTLSQIGGGDNLIVLCDITENEKAPIMLSCNCPALHDYLDRRCWTDREEKYITQTWLYNGCLDLVAIVIPSREKHRPAKIIAQADPSRWSEGITVFGPEALIDTPNPEPMSWEELSRWNDFRWEHKLYKAG